MYRLGTVAGYMDNPDCDVIVLENGNANGIQLNCSRSGPLSDVKVREAIRYAIDTDALNMVASAGQAHREDFYILASSGYYYDPTGGKGITADPQKAKELLAEAGYSDGFELDILGGASDEEILTAIQSMLSAVGITANINMPDRSVMVPMSESGEYDIFYGGHPAALKFRSLETFKQIEPNSAGAGKYMGGPKITDPVLQELIDKATKELDDKAAAESIKEIVQYIYDSACYIGVHGGIMTSVAAKGLTGIAMDAGACIDLSGIHPAS